MAELDTIKLRSGAQTFCDYFCITWLLRLACAAAIVGTSGQKASKLSSKLLKLFFKHFMHAGSCGSAPIFTYSLRNERTIQVSCIFQMEVMTDVPVFQKLDFQTCDCFYPDPVLPCSTPQCSSASEHNEPISIL